MNYTVVWLPDAEAELADIWLQAADRDAITQVSNLIDQRLRRDPEHEGEARDDGRRILFVPPLGVLFRVSPDDRLVQVIHVWQF